MQIKFTINSSKLEKNLHDCTITLHTVKIIKHFMHILAIAAWNLDKQLQLTYCNSGSPNLSTQIHCRTLYL